MSKSQKIQLHNIFTDINNLLLAQHKFDETQNPCSKIPITHFFNGQVIAYSQFSSRKQPVLVQQKEFIVQIPESSAPKI